MTPLLRQVLKELMAASLFAPFRLVGGTSLSLQRGHRISIDIDLFTDAPYDSIDFKVITQFLCNHFDYVDSYEIEPVGIGKSYYVGNSENESVKLDFFYTDTFIRPAKVIDGIRIATEEEIIAMKIDVIQRGGRKKDFWDLHEVMDEFTLENMFELHKERYPYNHNRALIKKNFCRFKKADNDFDPICLRQKQWQLIKLDLLDFSGKANDFN